MQPFVSMRPGLRYLVRRASGAASDKLLQFQPLLQASCKLPCPPWDASRDLIKPTAPLLGLTIVGIPIELKIGFTRGVRLAVAGSEGYGAPQG